MKKGETAPSRFDSLTEAHRAFGAPDPQHPLISLVNTIDHQLDIKIPSEAHVLGFYKIGFKPNVNGRLRYGQSYYDFDKGGLLFASPNQIIGGDTDAELNDACHMTLLIHPDFLWNYPLAKKIKQYNFFSYTTNETLHLSDKEKEVILALFKNIESELEGRIDELSQDVIIAQIELLLHYANRFYKRQFITRKAHSDDVLQKLEELLDAYFGNELSLKQGLPTVQYLSDHLNISAGYLSDMLRSLTGQNAQQHIHNKLIEKAKEKLSITKLSVSEIAYELGFEHPQSFSKLFKNKTNLTPLEFRNTFN
jgi:AraC family transcriptional activator of pobA